MHQQHTDPVAEVKRMQRCMNDLVGVLALPAVWSVSEPSRILDTFLDALMEMLDLDFLYAHVQADSREAPVDALRTAPRFEICQSRDEIMLALKQGFEEVPHTWHERVCRHLGGQEISVFPIRMGIEGELGLIIAGSQRLGFPEQPESLVLHVAANQLAIGLQHALRLYEQSGLQVNSICVSRNEQKSLQKPTRSFNSRLDFCSVFLSLLGRFSRTGHRIS